MNHVDLRRPELIVEVDAHEGPVYVGSEHALYFTTVPRHGRVDIKRVDLASRTFTTVRADANVANGMTLAPDGRLLVCEQGTFTEPARITAVDVRSGAVETIVDDWHGLPFNSPNDIVVASDGALWFTDPSYGYLQGFRPAPASGDHVYRHDPRTGQTTVVADAFDKPNGLAFSPDESILYVGDSGANQEPGSFDATRPHQIVAFDVVDGQRLRDGRLFAVTDPGFPDGIKVVRDGRVFASAFSGVQVFSPRGELIDEIPLPGAVNFAFDDDERVLFITADTAVWAVDIESEGA
jgi:gluconolactonase